MIFKDRMEAAQLLSQRLSAYQDKNPLVLALPRGAVPMAQVIAARLNGELGVILTRKVSIPGSDEFAIGAVSASGIVYKNPHANSLPIPESIFLASLNRQVALIEERQKKYGLDKRPYSAKGRVTILVDDGIATGSTMIVAIREVRLQNPEKVVVAAAVAPRDTAELLESEADEVVLLDRPKHFYAVGQFFIDFSEVNDEDVLRALALQPHDLPQAKRPEMEGR